MGVKVCGWRAHTHEHTHRLNTHIAYKEAKVSRHHTRVRVCVCACTCVCVRVCVCLCVHVQTQSVQRVRAFVRVCGVGVLEV